MLMSPTPRRHELTDEQWEKLEPLLPPQKPRTGRPNKDHRTIINGILWILKTGAQWEDLPERYGSSKTVSSRLYRWRKAGVWDKVLAELQQMGDTLGEVQWTIHYVDGTSIRAHQSAAGAKKGVQIQDPADQKQKR
jgi:transposase